MAFMGDLHVSLVRGSSNPQRGVLRCVGLHDVRRDELLNTTGATRECISMARPHVHTHSTQRHQETCQSLSHSITLMYGLLRGLWYATACGSRGPYYQNAASPG